MDLVYLPEAEPATPAYVLAVLRDRHHQQCRWDSEADPEIRLSSESTVADWRAACDLVAWRPLGRACNEDWGIDRPDAEWLDVLEPADRRRLAGVCEFIAGHATRPRIRPARLLGKGCGPAGAFLTIRSLLHRAGATTRELTPSSPLAPYARLHQDIFLGEVARLAPGAMPPVTIRTPAYDRMVSLMALSLVGLGVGAALGYAPVVIVAAFLFVVGHAGSSYAARCIPPASVEFDGLQTFRDLAIAIDRAPSV